jgi:HTH-type transcriptional regulator/antitoxin HigA
MENKTIKTKIEYTRSIKRFEEIFQAKQGTTESEEADLLALLIKEYEEKHFAISYSNPN